MPFGTLSRSELTISDDFSSGHVLAAAIAWTVISALCYRAVLPLSNSRFSESIYLDQTWRLPVWFQSRYVDATLMFAFHAIVSANNHINIWVLPSIAIAVCLLPKSSGNLDGNVRNLVQLITAWRAAPNNKTSASGPLVWLAACGISIVTALLSGCTMMEFGIGLLCVAVGVLLYTVTQSILNPEFESSRELQKRLLMPIALQSAGTALLVWVVVQGKASALGSLMRMSIISTLQGFAVVMSVLEGTALPVLATLPVTAILRSSIRTHSWPSSARVVLLTSAAVQILLSLPNDIKKRRNLGVFIIAPLVVVSAFESLIFDLPSSLTTADSVHPVRFLHERNKAEFERKVSTQSRDHLAAETEYSTRYGRNPPPNFDRWFAVAMENEFQLPDEFDTIMTSIMPYWGLPQESLRRRIRSASEGTGIHLVEVRKSNATFNGDHYHGGFITGWINKYTELNLFPDFDFAVNVLDEPRISAPYTKVKSALNHWSDTHLEADGNDTITWETISKKNLKADLSPACPSELSKSPEQDYPLPFISNVTMSKDFCHNPSLFNNHGFFQSPETLILTRQLVPILSQCKPNGFNDILYPSPYYTYLEGRETLKEEDDMDWEFKQDNLYWSGSSTGGHSTLTNWRHLHRQHLALLSTTESNTPLQLLSPVSPTQNPHNTTWSTIRSLLNIRLNRAVQCDKPACEAMKSAFPLIGTSDPVEMSVASKFALDMDGNTFTGRFYRLLKSKSCVLKMTAFKEWHDSFLVPWVHYIPVSSGFEELGEIVRYLNRDEEGKELGKRIAEGGRTWARKVLREVDLELVALRVLMEVARIMNGDEGVR